MTSLINLNDMAYIFQKALDDFGFADLVAMKAGYSHIGYRDGKFEVRGFNFINKEEAEKWK